MTLTNHLKKTFERILKKLVVEYLESNKVMNPIQQRYRNKRSTISQILSSYEDIISKLENGDDVDVIYLDFSKTRRWNSLPIECFPLTYDLNGC